MGLPAALMAAQLTTSKTYGIRSNNVTYGKSMTHIPPEEVKSPQVHWKLLMVLLDGGPNGGAYAAGLWDDEPRIGFRWNGSVDNPIGNPQSRGLPTWTMLDPRLHEAVLEMVPLERRMEARRALGTGVVFEAGSAADPGLRLWDLRGGRGLVASVRCDALRDALHNVTISDEECRLVADVNKHLFAEIAERAVAHGVYRLADDQRTRVVDVSLDDLRPYASKFSTSVLQVSRMSGF